MTVVLFKAPEKQAGSTLRPGNAMWTCQHCGRKNLQANRGTIRQHNFKRQKSVKGVSQPVIGNCPGSQQPPLEISRDFLLESAAIHRQTGDARQVTELQPMLEGEVMHYVGENIPFGRAKKRVLKWMEAAKEQGFMRDADPNNNTPGLTVSITETEHFKGLMIRGRSYLGVLEALDDSHGYASELISNWRGWWRRDVTSTHNEINKLYDLSATRTTQYFEHLPTIPQDEWNEFLKSGKLRADRMAAFRKAQREDKTTMTVRVGSTVFYHQINQKRLWIEQDGEEVASWEDMTILKMHDLIHYRVINAFKALRRGVREDFKMDLDIKSTAYDLFDGQEEEPEVMQDIGDEGPADEDDPTDYEIIKQIKIGQEYFTLKWYPFFGEYSLSQAVDGDNGYLDTLEEAYAATVSQCIDFLCEKDSTISKIKLTKAFKEWWS